MYPTNSINSVINLRKIILPIIHHQGWRLGHFAHLCWDCDWVDPAHFTATPPTFFLLLLLEFLSHGGGAGRRVRMRVDVFFFFNGRALSVSVLARWAVLHLLLTAAHCEKKRLSPRLRAFQVCGYRRKYLEGNLMT